MPDLTVAISSLVAGVLDVIRGALIFGAVGLAMYPALKKGVELVESRKDPQWPLFGVAAGATVLIHLLLWIFP